METFSALSLFNRVASLLKGVVPSEEIQPIQRLIFEKKLNLNLHKIYLEPTLPINPKDAENVLGIVSELKLQKPIQYILGETDFFGLNFLLTPDVLIPRQETEELVDWIVKSNAGSISSILDIGTGSGCISIALAKNISNAKVSSIDVSDKALELATRNAVKNGVEVSFYRIDFLDHTAAIPSAPFDLIVSNPPYVRGSEKVQMQANVLENEPHLALFVDDADPLVFYRAIAQRASELLNDGGKVFCEINEALGEETKALFYDNGFADVELRKDLNGKDRMIKASWR